MSMTKKDYTVVAGVINSALWEDHIDPLTVVRIASLLSVKFKQDYPGFRPDIFLNECIREQGKP